METRTLLLTAVTIAVTASSPSLAAKCSTYEREVYDVARAVAEFRQSDQFVNRYGWAANGPFGNWLEKIRRLQADKANALKLMEAHGFTPMDIYGVADEYRTAGSLDSYYVGVDNSIRSHVCR